MKKIFIIFTFILLITGCNNNEDKSLNKILNNNENVIKEQIIDDYKINNISLVYENGLSTFTAFINNNTSDIKVIKEFKVILKNETGNIITILEGPEMKIEANKYFIVTISSDIDLSEVSSVEYQIK